MTKLFFLIFIFLIQSFPSFGEWKKVANNNLGSVFYIDFERLRIIDGYIHHWTLIDYNRKKENGLRSETNYRKVDCNKFRFMFLDGSLHTEPMGKGQRLQGKINQKWSALLTAVDLS